MVWAPPWSRNGCSECGGGLHRVPRLVGDCCGAGWSQRLPTFHPQVLRLALRQWHPATHCTGVVPPASLTTSMASRLWPWAAHASWATCRITANGNLGAVSLLQTSMMAFPLNGPFNALAWKLLKAKSQRSCHVTVHTLQGLFTSSHEQGGDTRKHNSYKD